MLFFFTTSGAKLQFHHCFKVNSNFFGNFYLSFEGLLANVVTGNTLLLLSDYYVCNKAVNYWVTKNKLKSVRYSEKSLLVVP